jgi:hypothetical protein
MEILTHLSMAMRLRRAIHDFGRETCRNVIISYLAHPGKKQNVDQDPLRGILHILFDGVWSIPFLNENEKVKSVKALLPIMDEIPSDEIEFYLLVRHYQQQGEFIEQLMPLDRPQSEAEKLMVGGDDYPLYLGYGLLMDDEGAVHIANDMIIENGEIQWEKSPRLFNEPMFLGASANSLRLFYSDTEPDVKVVNIETHEIKTYHVDEEGQGFNLLGNGTIFVELSTEIVDVGTGLRTPYTTPLPIWDPHTPYTIGTKYIICYTDEVATIQKRDDLNFKREIRFPFSLVACPTWMDDHGVLYREGMVVQRYSLNRRNHNRVIQCQLGVDELPGAIWRHVASFLCF